MLGGTPDPCWGVSGIPPAAILPPAKGLSGMLGMHCLSGELVRDVLCDKDRAN